MTYADYVRGISFRFYKPGMSPRGYTRLSGWLRRSPIPLEILNTRLPEDAGTTRRRLVDLCQIPKMSTFAIGAMINKAVSLMSSDLCFLNVGVWHGFTFLAGLIGNGEKRCIGVDNFSQFGGPAEQFLERFREHKSPNHYFHDMDYNEYFSQYHSGKIGVYLYDGEHSYDNQMKGLELAEPFFAEDCLIIVDDTNWEAPRQATMDFVSKSANGYRILLDRGTLHNNHPTLWNGIMVLQRTTD
jgi:hypothetical protein